LLQVLLAALVALNTVIFGGVVTLVSFLDPTRRAPLAITRVWGRIVLAIYGVRIFVEGADRVPRDQPVVVMSNHQSVFDILALLETLPIPFRFVAKKELLRVPVFGWAVWASGQIVIDRQNRTRAVASLRRAAARVREGASVMIFPEGTRSADGRLQSFKSGGFHLAIEAQVPVLPVTVSGSQFISEKGTAWVRRGRAMKITYGTPIPTEGLRPGDREELKNRVRAAIEAGYDPAHQAGATQ
jgi:1-acyl-sn-glycerol-3-phosphate acyltransferase